MTTVALRRPRSEEAFEEACKLMPGGVNSPVRAFKSVGGNPVFIQKAKGAYMWDVDGNRYIDYVGTWGPAILGHAHPDVVQRIQQVAENGTSFGAPTLLENELAQLVIDRVPSIEKVRFVNSGTEACLSAARLARAYTGREKLIKFEGCYHGHADSFLVKAGSGALTLGTPDSPGVPAQTASLTLTAQFNNLDSVKTLLENNAGEVAAIMLEPVTGNMGCILPKKGFLEGLRQLCDQHGCLLIFDEVMTGFRVSAGGAQQYYNITPDLTCLGKIIGGGLPVGAYGGKAEIMAYVAPEGSMYQAGTLSGNPLAMASGIETLKRLNESGFYEALTDKTNQLINGLVEICRGKNIPAYGTSVGAMFSLYFTDQPVTDFASVQKTDTERFNRFFWAMLDRGVYLAPSKYEAGFLSIAHSDADIEETLKAASEVL